jgi:hypothetical protein
MNKQDYLQQLKCTVSQYSQTKRECNGLLKKGRFDKDASIAFLKNG